MDRNFDFQVDLVRAYKDGAGRPHVVGEASDNLPDLHLDRMGDPALKMMAEQCKTGLPLLETHRSTFKIGITKDGKVVQRGRRRTLEVDFELDPKYPQAVDLFASVMSKGRSTDVFQLSIGGLINLKNPNAIRWEDQTTPGGKKKDGAPKIRVLDDIALKHIAVTPEDGAANPRTRFTAATVKEIDPLAAQLLKDAGGAREPDYPGTVLQVRLAAEPEPRFIHAIVKDVFGAETDFQDWDPQELWAELAKTNGGVDDTDLPAEPVLAKSGTATAFSHPAGVTEPTFIWSQKEADAVFEHGSWGAYKSAHGLFDSGQDPDHPEMPEKRAAYGLPHHVVRDGTLKAHWPGVALAMGTLLRAHGDCAVAERDRDPIYRHLARHYMQFGKRAPTLRDWDWEEFLEFHRAQDTDLVAATKATTEPAAKAAKTPAATDAAAEAAAEAAKEVGIGARFLATLGKLVPALAKAAETETETEAEQTEAEKAAAEKAAAETEAEQTEAEKAAAEKAAAETEAEQTEAEKAAAEKAAAEKTGTTRHARVVELVATFEKQEGRTIKAYPLDDGRRTVITVTGGSLTEAETKAVESMPPNHLDDLEALLEREWSTDDRETRGRLERAAYLLADHAGVTIAKAAAAPPIDIDALVAGVVAKLTAASPGEPPDWAATLEMSLLGAVKALGEATGSAMQELDQRLQRCEKAAGTSQRQKESPPAAGGGGGGVWGSKKS